MFKLNDLKELRVSLYVLMLFSLFVVFIVTESKRYLIVPISYLVMLVILIVVMKRLFDVLSEVISMIISLFATSITPAEYYKGFSLLLQKHINRRMYAYIAYTATYVLVVMIMFEVERLLIISDILTVLAVYGISIMIFTIGRVISLYIKVRNLINDSDNV